MTFQQLAQSQVIGQRERLEPPCADEDKDLGIRGLEAGEIGLEKNLFPFGGCDRDDGGFDAR